MTDIKELDTSPDNVVELVQAKRLEMLLDDTSDIDKTRLELMRDLAKTATDTNRIQADKTAADSNAELARALIAGINSSKKDDPFAIDVDYEVIADEANIPTLSQEDLPEFELNDNETSTEQSSMTYKEMFAATDEE